MKKPVGHRQVLKKTSKDRLRKIHDSRASSFIDQCLEVLSRIKPDRQSNFQIGDKVCAHWVYGGTLSDFLFPALAHLEVGSNAIADMRIYSVDGNACRVDLPRPFWPWEQLDTQGYIQGMNSPVITAQYDVHTSTFRILHRTRGIAIHWVREMANIPYWERSFPLRSLINWWFRDTALQPLHAAAVGAKGDGVLLAAKGGSGKSTTALHCLFDKMQYLGDDFVLVDSDQHTVHSLYNVVKLTPEDIGRFPQLEKNAADAIAEDQDKVQIFLHEKFQNQMARSANLKCILIPKIVSAQETRLSEVTHDEVLTALTASTLYLLRGDSSDTFRKISRLVRTLPSYLLNLGADYNTSPTVIKNLLAEI